jgi:hypothetical protein
MRANMKKVKMHIHQYQHNTSNYTTLTHRYPQLKFKQEPFRLAMATRKAPMEKANTYDLGVQMAGSDGLMYEVKADKNGKLRWIKVAVEKKTRTATKSPKEKAATMDAGTMMEGLDGAMYIVKESKTGTKRWYKVETETKKPEEESQDKKPEEETEDKKPEEESEDKKEKEQTEEEAEHCDCESSGSSTTTTKPKPVRKAPKESAGKFEEGHQMEGSDGNLYIVKADKNGTKKWQKRTRK